MTSDKSLSQGESPFRFLHTMLRVGNLERSLAFYVGKLGMQLLRREEYPEGRFTLAFVGYSEGNSSAAIELTYNWGCDAYDHGDAFGHIALAVTDLKAICTTLDASGVRVLRAPGPMTFTSPSRVKPEAIAFIEDPDGYRIELVET